LRRRLPSDQFGEPDGAAEYAIRANLTDLVVASRSLVTHPEIAVDADDLIVALAGLHHNLRALLKAGDTWAAAELCKFLILAVYEREQTLWAESAPPGAPFHSQGVGLHALTKGIEWLLAYITNHALGVPRGLERERVRDTVVRGLHRAPQASLHRSELEADDDAFGVPRWTGCVCLTMLQGVYTSPGGVVHFTDLFTEELATTAPRAFHEAGHLLFELRGWGKKELGDSGPGIKKYMEDTAAAEGPIRRIIEETFAHWVEYMLFGGAPDLLVRTMWQTWYTSAYGARHPLDALQRTAAVYLIPRVMKLPAMQEALLRGDDMIRMGQHEADSLVAEAVEEALDGVQKEEPFGIESPSIPMNWSNSLSRDKPEQFRDLMTQALRNIVMPFLRVLLVQEWELGQNLQDLHDLTRDDYGNPTLPDGEAVADVFLRQQQELLTGKVVTERLVKPVKQVLEVQRLVTEEATRLGKRAFRDKRWFWAAQVDAALMLSLAGMWQLNSTYLSYLAAPGARKDGGA